MATAKKKSAKKSTEKTSKRSTSKKNAKKSSKKSTQRSTRPAKKTANKRLSVDEKNRKLKPGDDFNELVTEVVTAWRLVPRRVRVPDVTTAKLASLARKAAKAQEREAQLAAKQAQKLAPLSDARLIAGDAAYRAALQVKRIADAVAATDPEVAAAFAPVTERFRRRASSERTSPTREAEDPDLDATS